MRNRFDRQSSIYLSIGFLCLVVSLIGARSTGRQYAQSDNTDGSAQKLQVTRMKQPGSPLTISNVTVDDSEEPLMPAIHCNITNQSGKAITAYAVKHEAVFSQRTGTFSGSITFDRPHADKAMRPGDTQEVEIYGVKYGEMPQAVTLSVDFVEFIDGKRWGPDSLKNGDRIDGGRAGAKAERDALTKVMITTGIAEIVRSLDSIQPEPDQTLQHSAEWLDGFRGGVGWMREQIRSKGNSLAALEKELRDGNRERR